MTLSSAEAQALAELRLIDSLLLMENSRYSSAYYLSGYALEMSLKAIIAKQFLANVVPDKVFVQNIYSHDLSKLLGLTGLKQALIDHDERSPGLNANWLLASQWSKLAL